MFDPSRKKGISAKLQSRWLGPYKIVGKLSDLLYKIQLTPNSKIKIVHHDRLKLGYGKKEVNSTIDIVQDSDEVEVLGNDSESDLANEVMPEGVTTRSGRKTKLPKKLQDCIL